MSGPVYFGGPLDGYSTERCSTFRSEEGRKLSQEVGERRMRNFSTDALAERVAVRSFRRPRSLYVRFGGMQHPPEGYRPSVDYVWLLDVVARDLSDSRMPLARSMALDLVALTRSFSDRSHGLERALDRLARIGLDPGLVRKELHNRYPGRVRGV